MAQGRASLVLLVGEEKKKNVNRDALLIVLAFCLLTLNIQIRANLASVIQRTSLLKDFY